MTDTSCYKWLVGFLDLAKGTDVDDAKWEPFQRQFLNDENPLAVYNKSRQIAWSWTAAGKSLYRASQLGRKSLFLSINLNEAKQKLTYSREIMRALLPQANLPKIEVDNATEIAFANGGRIVSLPSKPPRGYPKYDIYADEFAHVGDDQNIYKGMLPVISKGGNLAMGSSPMGASGVFYDIFSQDRQPYPGYHRVSIPWWSVYAFCNDVPTAIVEAPKLTTAQRVERFGRDRIQLIYSSMLLEDFQQEYECLFVDEVTAWITWDEIKRAQRPDPFFCIISRNEGNDISDALRSIGNLQRELGKKAEKIFALGMDVGRTNNATEIFLIGVSESSDYTLRLAITLNNTSFELQEEVLRKIMRFIPLVGGLIDKNGIGMQLAEKMETGWPQLMQGAQFSQPSKVMWATNAKMVFQKGLVRLPTEREIGNQIHSIKRIVTASNNVVYDTARNEKHHADKWWALALALYVAVNAGNMSMQETSAPIFKGGISPVQGSQL